MSGRPDMSYVRSLPPKSLKTLKTGCDPFYSMKHPCFTLGETWMFHMMSRQRRQDHLSGTPPAGIRLLGVLAAQKGRFILPGKKHSGGRGGVRFIIGGVVS
jgi:hypothetical protein